MIIVTIATTSNNTISDSTTPAIAPPLKDDLFLLDISDGSLVLSVSVCDGGGVGVAPGVVAVVEAVMKEEDSIGCGGRAVAPLSGRVCSEVEEEGDNEYVLVSVGLMDIVAGKVALLVALLVARGTAEMAKCISMREREHCYIVNTVVYNLPISRDTRGRAVWVSTSSREISKVVCEDTT